MVKNQALRLLNLIWKFSFTGSLVLLLPSLLQFAAYATNKSDAINSHIVGSNRVSFNVMDRAQTILGVGANNFTDMRDTVFRPANDPSDPGLGVSYVRWWLPISNSTASTANLAPLTSPDPQTWQTAYNSYYDWWKAQLALQTPQHQSFLTLVHQQNAILEKFGVHKIATVSNAPLSWQGSKNYLPEGDEIGCALFAAAGLAYLHDQGIDFEYIEYFNEPDGNWNTHLSARQLATFSAVLHQQLIYVNQQISRQNAAREKGKPALELLEVAILASGLSHMDDPNGDMYLSSFLSSDIQRLGALSVHTYEWNNTNNSSGYFLPHMKAFMQYLTNITPHVRELTVFATEYAPNEAGPYHGITYGTDPLTCYSDSNSDTGTCVWLQQAYGARLFNYLLGLLNAGVALPVVWIAYDYDWGSQNVGQNWGLISAPSRGNHKRHSFYMLQTLYPKISQGEFTVVKPRKATVADGVHAAALISGSTVLVSMVNDSEYPEQIELAIEGVDNTRFVSAESYSGSLCDGHLCSQKLAEESGTWTINLPVDGVITATFKIKF